MSNVHLTPEQLRRGLEFYNSFEPKNEEETKDKRIMELFYVEGLTAGTIAKLNDPLLKSRQKKNGKYSSINRARKSQRLYKYFPDLKAERTEHRELSSRTKERQELYRSRRKVPSKHIRQCAFCGKIENLEEHHMIPLYMGGTSDNRNLVFLCHDCHYEVSLYQRTVQKHK